MKLNMDKINSKVIGEIKDLIAQKISPVKIILFGSLAKGDEKEGSDLDLLIIKESSLPRHKRAKEIRLLLSKYIFGKDILVYTPDEIEEWKDVPDAFITTVMKEGKVLYEEKS